jgi:predicted RNA-binding Zn-ribbon protein involved in translation (DUF1610 family)
MRTISMHCPKCGTEHWSRINELARDFVCKDCGVTYHVDRGGRCVRGPRPTHTPDEFEPISREAHNPRFDPIGYWANLPWLVKFASLAALLLVAGLSTARMLTVATQKVPEALEDRTEYVALSFTRGSPEDVSRVADPSTVVSIPRWIDRFRPPTWDRWLGTTPAVNTTVLFMNPKNRTAATVATIKLPALATKASDSGARSKSESSTPTGPADASRGPTLEILLHWRLAESGLWMLDAGQTLRSAGPRQANR